MKKETKERNPLLKGQKFNKLTVLGLDHKKEEIYKYKNEYKLRYRYFYKCKCDCGEICIVEKSAIITGNTKSCGCLQKQSIIKRCYMHGLSDTKIYSIWGSIKDRCFRKKCKDYKNYGGRGITICNEWKNDFINFYNWAMNNGYKEGLTIERIDVNGNYEPKNCKWIKNNLQSKNKTNNHYLTYKGKTQIIEDWAKEMKLNNGATIFARLKRGWTIEESLTIPIGQKRKK